MSSDPGAIVRAAARQIGEQLGGRGTVRRGLAVSGAAPDLAVLAPARPGPGAAAPAVEAVLDVLPHARDDLRFAARRRAHAAGGIPVYVVVDPAEGLCTVHSDPEPSGLYRTAEHLPFGADLFLQLAGRTLVVGTDEFPRDPG
ncbi:Uma2 family endonuclease [Kitasatospora sp. NPDC059571]|uniref:Uma2 family endonuclease n=1 Tax=Kitasatospora sp. NPDC059571 TaxID=3346871 RepID=UPI0036AE2748